MLVPSPKTSLFAFLLEATAPLSITKPFSSFAAATMAGLSRLGLATASPALHRLGMIASTRAYGSGLRLRGVVGLGRGVQWVLIGDSGAQKHVYAEKLSKLLQVPHISMGALLRQELNPSSSLYKQIANAVNGGNLVPEEIIFGLLSKRLEEGYCRGETGFILDGIPRTRIQAEILDQIADIDLVVNFKCTKDNLVKRDFLTVDSMSSVTDAGSALKEKFRIYAEQGKALEDYYRKQKKLVDFQVAGAPGEIWQGLLATLHLKHLGAVNSSQKLTA
ncbi:hypothetical protein GH714_009172 [Hevea brasiliensis]|uniref:adenylate kinase n=1 Tax=Hevea brasiliensis TaxID=3981 RepID=A0A6A6M0U2_HEVBR|nr:hypothetical protein GH714_009172 [Hevea brasiliensis]